MAPTVCSFRQPFLTLLDQFGCGSSWPKQFLRRPTPGLGPVLADPCYKRARMHLKERSFAETDEKVRTFVVADVVIGEFVLYNLWKALQGGHLKLGRPSIGHSTPGEISLRSPAYRPLLSYCAKYKNQTYHRQQQNNYCYIVP